MGRAHSLSGFLLLAGISACSGAPASVSPPSDLEVVVLRERNAALEAEKLQKEEDDRAKAEYIEELTRTIIDVQDGLRQLRKRESTVLEASMSLEGAQPGDVSQRERIQADLKTVQTYFEESRGQLEQLQAKVVELEARAKSERFNLTSFQKMIVKLQEELRESELQVADLDVRITKLTAEKVELEQVIADQSNVIAQQTEKLNAGRYITGTKQQLKDSGVIEETGGFLRFGRTRRLRPGFDESLFKPVDTSAVSELPIGSGLKEYELISPHNPYSYTFVSHQDGSVSLRILDREQFWRYPNLVVLVK
jgi:hypothetical protein